MYIFDEINEWYINAYYCNKQLFHENMTQTREIFDGKYFQQQKKRAGDKYSEKFNRWKEHSIEIENIDVMDFVFCFALSLTKRQ